MREWQVAFAAIKLSLHPEIGLAIVPRWACPIKLRVLTQKYGQCPTTDALLSHGSDTFAISRDE